MVGDKHERELQEQGQRERERERDRDYNLFWSNLIDQRYSKKLLVQLEYLTLC